MADRRFGSTFRTEPTDEAGLVLEDDDVVYIVKPDGTRVPAAGGGGSQTDVPQADPTGFDIDTTTYDNPISGSGKLTTLVAKAAVNGGDNAVFAVAVEGDAFPRILLESTGDGLYMGDGTFDPYDQGAGVATLVGAFGAIGELFAPGGSFSVGETDDNGLNFNKSHGSLQVGASRFQLNAGDPNGSVPGLVGDLFFRTDGDGSLGQAIYRCTVPGLGGVAVWVGLT